MRHDVVDIRGERDLAARIAVSTERRLEEHATPQGFPDGFAVPLPYVSIRPARFPLPGVVGTVAERDDSRASRGGTVAHTVSQPGKARAPSTPDTMRVSYEIRKSVSC